MPLTADHRVDLPALAAAITPATRLVFVCNPNNPTGTTITKQEFEEFMPVVPPTTLVALDEAYFEFVRTQDTPMGTEVVVKHENVVALRRFPRPTAWRECGLGTLSVIRRSLRRSIRWRSRLG